MYKILAVTNRTLCEGDFLKRIDQIARNHVDGIILREKDLGKEEYYDLASQVVAICRKHQVPCILHTYIDVANQLGVKNIHLPLFMVQNGIIHTNELRDFDSIGMSIHSKEEAIIAEKMGATYITAGHIFETDCKKGVPPRGLEYLQDICNAVTIPVYGIGGITNENLSQVIDKGATGVCIMSGFMRGILE